MTHSVRIVTVEGPNNLSQVRLKQEVGSGWGVSYREELKGEWITYGGSYPTFETARQEALNCASDLLKEVI